MNHTTVQTVVVLGASAKPQRYSYQALQLLAQYHHTVIPVHPTLTMIENFPVRSSLSEINIPVDTLTLYVGSNRSDSMLDEIIALRPRRVIFNPGTESTRLEERLSMEGIPYIFDCTLVMLQSHEFDF